MLSLYKNLIELIEQNDTISLFKQIKLATKLSYHIESLTKIAFDGMKPFPNRNEIHSKQILCNKILSEAWHQRKFNNHIYFKQEKLV